MPGKVLCASAAKSSLTSDWLICARGFRAFGGRHDRPLHRARRIAADIEPWHVSRLIWSRADSALVVELAAEAARQLGVLGLSEREEQRAALERRTREKNDPLQLTVGPDEARHAALVDLDAVQVQPLALGVFQLRRPVRRTSRDHW